MTLTVEQHGDTVKQALAAGKSYRTIAAELGCHYTTVSAFVAVNFPAMRRALTANQYSVPVPAEPTLPPVSHVPMKMLVIDIETRPNLAYVWGVWNQNIHPKQLVDEKSVISFAAKWLGDDEMLFYSTFHEGKEKMITAAHRLLSEADAVIHYNGTKFDIPHLNQEFLLAGLKPPTPFKQIDLLRTARSKFNFTHNKLDHIAATVLDARKVEHAGFALWLKCMDDDPDAWARMKEYNCCDVLLTERLYHELLPWITQHPSYAAFHGDKRCTNCGSERLKGNGYQYTKTGRYQRFTCRDCGTHCRDTHRQSVAEVTQTAA